MVSKNRDFIRRRLVNVLNRRCFCFDSLMAVNACITVMWTFNFQMCNIEHVTALMCVFAVGKVAPTFLIYPNNYPVLSTDIDFPQNWLFGI